MKEPADWQQRLQQAETLSGNGVECSMCGGTGGWPGPSGFVLCKPCDGTGSTTPTSNKAQ